MGVIAAEATAADIPFYRQFPRLKAQIPRLPLGTGPTPVARMSRLSGQLGGVDIWLKNDGLYGTVYGGNKPRKLEFILADALARDKRTIITMGAVGTNHGLATAIYGQQAGLNVVLLLTYQAPSPVVARNLALMHRFGAELHYTRSVAGTVPALMAAAWRSWRRDTVWPYILEPGGSSHLGALGFVNAGLELAEQIRTGEIPEPRTIILPVGTGGTAAGLLLGLRLAGLRSRLVAVPVTRAPTTRPYFIRALARRTAGLLRRRRWRKEVRLHGLEVLRCRDGYGQVTEDARNAIDALRESEGLVLEPTYTGRAAAEMMAMAREGRLREPVLYWHTHDALMAGEPVDTGTADLPRALRPFAHAS